MIHATNAGVMAAPSREPACVIPCAKPRSEGSIQRERDRVAIGNAPASPMPNRKRQAIMEPALHMPINEAQKMDHHATIPASARRGPKRSPSQPPGIWKIEYAHRNAPSIQPMVTTENPNSFWIEGTADEITTRSM